MNTTEMMNRWYKHISATGQRTKTTGERPISWKQETPAKLARAEFEQEKIPRSQLLADLAK
jgi:hypothetical protein